MLYVSLCTAMHFWSLKQEGYGKLYTPKACRKQRCVVCLHTVQCPANSSKLKPHFWALQNTPKHGTSQKSCARHFLGHREEVMRSFGVTFGLVPGRSDKKQVLFRQWPKIGKGKREQLKHPETKGSIGLLFRNEFETSEDTYDGWDASNDCCAAWMNSLLCIDFSL